MNEKEMLKQIAKQTMFQLSHDELNELVNEYHLFIKQVEAINQIDTSNIDPLAYPYEYETTYLREDDQTHTLSLQETLLNVKEVKDNQVKVPKVVK